MRKVFEKLLVVLLGHSEEIGDHQQGVRAGVLTDKLALAPGMEAVDLVVGQPSQRLLVLLEAFRCDQPHQEPALGRVLGRIE